MKLPNDVRKKLAEEFRFAADQMAAAQDTGRKLYFFSVFYGEALRAFNRTWSPELVLLHHVAQSAYQTMNARVGQVVTGADRVLGILPELPSALDQLAAELASIFEAKEIDDAQLHAALVRMAVVTYSTVGNGHYLYLKGDLKL